MKSFLKQKELIILVVLNIATMLLMIVDSAYPESLSINNFLLPVPFAILYALYGKRTLLLSLIIDIIFTMVITQNIVLTLISGFLVLVLGIIIGKNIKGNKGIGVSLLQVSVATILLSTLTISIYIYFIENISFYEIYNSTKEFVNNFLNDVSKTQDIKTVIISTEDILVNIPIMFMLYYMISSIINYFIALKVVAIIKKEKLNLRPFSQYYISNIMGAILIIGFCIGAIFNKYGFGFGNYISNAFYFILETLLIINGLAVTYNFLINKFKYSKTISIITLIGSLLILSDVFIVLGFIEMIIDYRRLDPHRIFRRK